MANQPRNMVLSLDTASNIDEVDFIESPEHTSLIHRSIMLLCGSCSWFPLNIDRRGVPVEPEEDHHLPGLVVPSGPAHTNPGARWVEAPVCLSVCVSCWFPADRWGAVSPPL